MYKKSPVIAAVFALVLGLTACGIGRDDEGKLDVVAGFYPLAYLSQQIGGNLIAVTTLAGKGVEPHNMKLSFRQRTRVADADLIENLAGFQPELDTAVSNYNKDRGFDAATVEPLLDGYTPTPNPDDPLYSDRDGKDPHVWLSPLRMANVAKALAKRMSEIEPSKGRTFNKAAGKLRGKLQAFDQEISTSLSNCQTHTLVTSHNAFGYFAERYGLKQLAIRGLDPEQQPSPQRLAEVVRLAKQDHVTTVFTESLVNTDLSSSVASQIGAKVAVLDPLETAPEGGDYFTQMRSNVQALRTALRCS